MTIHSDIDKVFSKGLSDYSEKAPSYIWDNIQQDLNSKRRQTKKIMYYAIAASAALLLSFGAGYMFKHKNNSTQLAKSENTIETNESHSNKISKNTPQVITEQKKEKATQTLTPPDVTNTKQKPTEKNSNHKTKNKEAKPSSKVKKASSSGTLLPPMFANQSNFESTTKSGSNSIVSPLKNEHSLQMLKKKDAKMNVPEFEKKLMRELREPPLIPMAYNDTKTNKPQQKWAIGVSGTPLISYRHVQNTNNELFYSAVNTSGLQQNYSNEKPLVSYSAGVNVNYNLSNRWIVQSGFYYSETGQVVEDIYFDQNPATKYNSANENYLINTSVGNIEIKNSQNLIASQIPQANADHAEWDNLIGRDGELSAIESVENNSTTTSDFVQTLEYYELPLIINYKIIDRKLDVKLAGGLSASFLSGNNTYLMVQDNRQDIDAEVNNIKNSHYSSILGIGLDYPIISQLFFSLNPTFRYSISAINTSGTTHPYSFGIYTGLKYSF